jgi:hypothetical protein
MRTWKWCAAAALCLGLVAMSAIAATTAAPARNATVRRGEYLVTLGGCNDCHTPWKMGPNGPMPDMSRMLSGHPEALVVQSAPPAPAQPWMATVSGTFTAWSGPWGTSFSANLTPDPETGLGKWTAQNFIESMRTGRHMGRGRPILPPMPWPNYAKATDDDLKAMFAYLKTVPAIQNRVPDPIPPEAATAAQEGAPPASAPARTAPARAGETRGSAPASAPRQ